MTDKEKQELYENICNDINCGTYILAPQYVDKLIAKLERKIASIRGSHRVDLAKLNARIEQVERLKKENAELKEKYVKNITDCDICDTYCNSQFTKAKEIIREFVEWATWQGNSKCPSFKSIQDKAEQFLKR